jgi:anti-sigma-K factor RskA
MSNIPVTAEDLYLYAMQLLDEPEQHRLEEFLKQSPEARAELANVRSDLGLLAMAVETQAPAPHARQRLMKQVARERRTAPAAVAAPVPLTPLAAATPPPLLAAVPEALAAQSLRKLTPIQPDSYGEPEKVLPFRSSYADEVTSKRSRGFVGTVAPWLGWALAAGMAVTAYDFYRKNEAMSDQVAFANATSAKATQTAAKAELVLETMRSGASQRFLLARQNTQPVPSARVTYLAENGSLVFQGSNMDQLPPYKTYELWLIPAGTGRQPIPAGTFKPDDHGFASVILPDLPKGVVAGTFGVTMEDDGGSQTPTLPILMIGS